MSRVRVLAMLATLFLLCASFFGVNIPKSHAQVFYAGAWIAPTDNFGTTAANGNRMNISMQLSLNPSDVSYVDFKATWPSGFTYIIDEVNPNGSKILSTSWDLKTRGYAIPNGAFQLQYDIYTTPGSSWNGYVFTSQILNGSVYPDFSYKLFGFLQGINTSYNGSGVPTDFAVMVKTLQTKYPRAHFFYYSYPSSNYPKYSCKDTFTDDIANDATYLSIQVNQQVAAHPEIRQTELFGHSLGGLVATSYATGVVEGVGTIFPLPSTTKLHVIAALDSPIGGTTAGIVANILTNVVATRCFGFLKIQPTLTALNQLQSLYATTTDHQHQGSSAIIVQAIFGQKFADSNKTVAFKSGMSFFEVGNVLDPLFAIPPTNAAPCSLVKDKFPSTQWITGYGFSIAGSQIAQCNDPSIESVHKAVLSRLDVLSAIIQVVNDGTPGLTAAP